MINSITFKQENNSRFYIWYNNFILKKLNAVNLLRVFVPTMRR